MGFKPGQTRSEWRTEQNYIDNPVHKPGVKEKISKAKKGGHWSVLPVNHRLWKGGISKDKEHKKFINREYTRRHKDRIKLRNQRRKAICRFGDNLSIKTIQEVYEHNIKEFGTLTCIYCFNPISFGNDTLEHIVPAEKDGDNNRDNLAIACAWCNNSKNKKLLAEWIGV